MGEWGEVYWKALVRRARPFPDRARWSSSEPPADQRRKGDTWIYIYIWYIHIVVKKKANRERGREKSIFNSLPPVPEQHQRVGPSRCPWECAQSHWSLVARLIHDEKHIEKKDAERERSLKRDHTGIRYERAKAKTNNWPITSLGIRSLYFSPSLPPNCPLLFQGWW